MEVKRYKPQVEKEWRATDDSAFSAKLYLDEGLVEFFTYPGGAHGPAFTTLEVWIAPHVYHVRLKRHYHWRWIIRIAKDFAWRAELLSRGAEVRS